MKKKMCVMNLYDAFMTPRERADLMESLKRGGVLGSGDVMPTAAKPEASPPMKPPMPKPDGDCLAAPSLAMVYSSRQAFDGLYSPAEALSRGTLFRGLDKPLMVGKGGKR